MLSAIVRFSLRFRGIVIALAIAFLAYGIYTLSHSKYDVFPEFAPPQVVIQTEAPGLSPEQVELMVTQPIENALNGAEGIDSLRSGSIQGLSVITVVFRPQTDIYRNRQLVAERLALVTGQLPAGIGTPVMTPLTSSTSTVLVAGLTSRKASLMELRTIAEWTVRRRLLAVPGVAKVALFGGEVRQLQIQIDPDRMIHFNLDSSDIVNAARKATGIQGAGFIETDNQRIVLTTEGQALTPEELAETVVVHHEETNITLDQVAEVVAAPEPAIGAATIMGEPGLMIMVSSQYGANTLEVTANIDEALEDLRPTLSKAGITLHPDLFRPANFILTATGNVRKALLLGAILVIVVLLLFLLDLRTAAISCMAIPLSLLGGTVVLERLGFTLNTLTLGGLAIAIGEVVDDAVIDVENILRRLRENRGSDHPRPALRVVLDASIEVRSAVVYATFAVVLAFFPILTMTGVTGRLFSPLGVAYICAVLTSLLVALTVTPALCLVWLGKGGFRREEPAVVRWLKKRYRRLLLYVERHTGKVLGAVGLLSVLGLSLLASFSGNLIPELREGHFVLHMAAAPGTSIHESLRIGGQVTEELLKIPLVRSVAQRVGRAEKADDTFGSHYSEMEVDLKPLSSGKDFGMAQAQIRQQLRGFAGVNFALKTFLTERMEETISGYTAPLVIFIFGSNLDDLDRDAQKVAGVLETIPGAADVQVESAPGTQQQVIALRRSSTLEWGFQPVEVLSAVRTAYQGELVGQVYEGNRVYGVSVVLSPQKRQNPDFLDGLLLRNPDGRFVPLEELATVYATSGRYIILHEGSRRVQTITCDIVGRDLSSFVSEARQRILSGVELHPSNYLEFAGAGAEQARARRDLLVHSLLAGMGIVLLLSVVLAHPRNVLLVLLNLPFALVGGVLAVFATGGSISLGSLVGFVTLFGITLRNAVMMISHYEHLVAVEGVKWNQECAIRGASERLVPILMTALVTGLGLLPLAIRSGTPGHEIEGPLAVVILGGLVTSTALNLLVLPALAWRFGSFQPSAVSMDAS